MKSITYSQVHRIQHTLHARILGTIATFFKEDPRPRDMHGHVLVGRAPYYNLVGFVAWYRRAGLPENSPAPVPLPYGKMSLDELLWALQVVEEARYHEKNTPEKTGK
jgi:hypothetical protein